MADAVKIETAKVKAYVDRVETLENEKRLLGDDVREVYDEAKKAGLNTKALRKIVAKRRAKAPDPQVEAAMHAYELALDEAAALVSNGETSLRNAATKTGFSKSAIQRQVSHRERITDGGTDITQSAAPTAPGEEDSSLSDRDEKSDEHSTPEGDENGNGNQQPVPGRREAGGAGIGDDAAVGPAGREPAPAAGPALAGGGETGDLRAAADSDADRDGQPGDAARADAGNAGVAACDGGDDQRGDIPPRRDLHAAAGTAVAAAPPIESCGGVETAHATSPVQGPVVSEPDETRPAVAGCASGTSHAQGNRPAGVASGPQDTIPCQEGPEAARVAPPVTDDPDNDPLDFPPHLLRRTERVRA